MKDNRSGIDHLGFQVDDLAATVDAAYANGAKPNDYELPRDGRFAETFVFDPVGQRVDLSQTGWKTQP
jgi:4-hydroxyphenylpyruvate dioxygenase-like putative hemolysin